MIASRIVAACAALALVSGGCGESAQTAQDPDGARSSRPESITTRVDLVPAAPADSDFDPEGIYEREAPGVVTVISLFGRDKGGEAGQQGGGGAGVGSGFVLSGAGEIVTNAHVVTAGEGSDLRRAREVYVEFADRNKVRARIVGHDPNADVAVLRVDPAGLTLRPLPLGRSARMKVGEPVVAIGSPFGERQSLSVGVVSAIDRSIRSLTAFAIPGAIQTDAAINPGNSGGPLVNARGEVIGINQQIKSTSGGGEGVGFAVPIDVVRQSVRQLRDDGSVEYAYLGVSTVELYPQLVERFGLPVAHGVWLQAAAQGGPAERAGLRGGSRQEVPFQGDRYGTGGDVITRVDGHPILDADDLSLAVTRYQPGDRVTVEVWRDGKRRRVPVTLAERPATADELP